MSNLFCLFNQPSMMFSADECQVLHNEGWYIVDASGEFLLQRRDQDAKLPDDHAAWKLVWDRAIAGSSLHMKALAFLHQFSPVEYLTILATVQKH